MDDLGTKSVVSSGGFSEVGAKRVCRKYHGGKCGGGIAVVCPALDEASFFGCRLFMLSQVPGSLKVLAAVEVEVEVGSMTTERCHNKRETENHNGGIRDPSKCTGLEFSNTA